VASGIWAATVVGVLVVMGCGSDPAPVEVSHAGSDPAPVEVSHAGSDLAPVEVSERALARFRHESGAYPEEQAGGSWAKAIAEGNIRVSLDWEAAKLLALFPTGAGSSLAELDLAGSNPSLSNRFGNALWPQCKKIAVSIFVDEDLPQATRAEMRSMTVNAVQRLRELTGLDFYFGGVVRGVEGGVVGVGGVVGGGEKFSTPDKRIIEPDEHTMEIHWVDHTNTWLAPDELGTATAWHKLSNLGATIGRARAELSSMIFRTLPDGRYDEPSRQLTVLHELAHLLGVGHSTDPDSFMYPSLGTVAWITPADRAALAVAGSRQCDD